LRRARALGWDHEGARLDVTFYDAAQGDAQGDAQEESES